MEGQCEDNHPRKMTAEYSRHTSNTSQQPSAYGDQTSILKERFEMMEEMDNKIRKEMFETMKEMDNKIRKEMFETMKEMDNKIRKEMFETMKEMDNKIRKEMFETMKEMENKTTWMDSENRTSTGTVNMTAHFPDNCNRSFPGRVIPLQDQEKEENEVLKEKNKMLEARCQKLLAKVMGMHQNSEDMNDPLRLSAVLQSYELLRLRQWEKVRSSAPHRWTYEYGSCIIRNLFDACEKDIQQRRDDILKALDIPLGNYTLTEEMKREITKLFRQPHYQNVSTVYKKIVQDPPVKAQWRMNWEYVEHVDGKDPMHWKNASLLWPIMKCGEDIIVKGVVWDQNDGWRCKMRLN